MMLSEVTNAVAAASIADIITQLTDPNKKSDFFRHALPEDRKLHLHYRQREFFHRIEALRAMPVSIPESAIDLESNLKPVVLKKNLYLLGLDENQFRALDDSIHQLLTARNGIAHGSNRAGIDSTTYSRLRKCSLTIMAGVQREISSALASERYRKHPPIVTPPPIRVANV